MTAPGGSGLARVTVAAPTRRLDVALPDSMYVGELLPHLLRHAGDSLADDGEQHGGWVLRRATGKVLEPTRNLAVQGVRDGELLHLSPARTEWPEPAYDDVVEVIASGARRRGRPWGRAETRRCGLTAAGAALVLGLGAVVAVGPPWPLPAGVALGVAAVLSLIGVVAARAFGDAGAGAAAAAAALPYALLGGALLAAPDSAGVTDLGAPGLLLGSAALLAASVIGYTGVAAARHVFTAGLMVGLAGLLGGGLSVAGVSTAGSAAVTLTAVIGLLPAYPLFASWAGRLPFPDLPDRPEGILADRPAPGRSDVFAAVARSDALLTGMLLATALAAGAGMAVVLLAEDDPHRASGPLVLAGGAALLLRGRLFPTVGQRGPLLIGGAVGLALPVLLAVRSAEPGTPRLLYVALLLAVATVLFAAALHFSRRSPSPYLGRIADIADVLAIMALIPLAAAVLGMYGAIQGLFASIGG